MTERPAPSVNAQAGWGLVVAVVAAGVDLAIYAIARALDVPMMLPEPGGDGDPTRLPISAVVAAAVVGIALGALALGILRQVRPEHATPWFRLGAAGFTLLSLSAPLAADTDTATKVALVSLHLATGLVAILALPWRPSRAPATVG